MRKSLFSAAALAPLMLLAAHGVAVAQTTIDDDRTTPVVTSTLSGDVTITANGSVTVTAGTAVTVDNNIKFTNNGTIAVNDADNGVGVLVTGPHTGDFLNTGAINVLEDFTPTDTNEDGVADGPYAEGTGRYGIRVTGPTFTGLFTNSGSVTVEGNDSFGISLESAMVGDVLSSGGIRITGDDTVGFRTTSTVDGDLRIQGQILATGGGARAMVLGDDISGALSIYNTIQSTGYRTTLRPNTPDALAKILPENILEAGPALTIAGDVAGGVFLGAPPTIPPDSAEDLDQDKDGIPDRLEGTSSILVFGQAPALLIGATGRDVALGLFGPDENAYGLIIRGRVEGSGVFDGKQANAIQIGTGDGTVHIAGGVRNVGVVRTTALEANSTAFRMLAGAETPVLRNEGQIIAQAASDDEDSVARAIVIEEGASLGAITNADTIQAKMVSDTASAVAIVDHSGTLTSITNNNRIIATVERTADGDDTPEGQAIAMDLRANTTGVTISQASIKIGEVDTIPQIVGDVLLGSGGDTFNLRGGTVTGALDFGGGANSILIDNGATYLGALSTSGMLGIDIVKGRLDNRSASTIVSSGLHIGSEGVLLFAVDPANNQAGLIDVNGAAVLDTGAKLGVNILSLPQGTVNFTIVDADSLTVGTPEADLLTATPFLFVTTADVDQAAGTIDLAVRRRTAEEAGFNAAETAAYDSIYEDLPRDSGILSAMVNQTTQEGLLGIYDQMLPDHAGGVTRALAWASEAAGRAAADWPRGETSAGPTRGWTQEIGLGERKDRADASAYRIYGFGAVGGVESMAPDGGALGLYAGFTTANVNNPDTPGDDEIGLSQLSLAGYWRGAFGKLHADAQAGAGYVWADSKRELIYSDTTQVVHRVARADWSGYSLFARAGLAYDHSIGRLVITPTVHIDYFRLYQGGYTETGGGPGFDLDIEAKTSDVLSATASVVIGYAFGGRTKIRPELELGWRQVIAGSAGATEGQFVAGGIPFTLFGEPIEGGGAIARLGLRVFNEYVDLRLDAGAEIREQYTDLDIRITARVVL